MDHNPFDDGEPLTRDEVAIAITLAALTAIASITYGVWLFCNT